MLIKCCIENQLCRLLCSRENFQPRMRTTTHNSRLVKHETKIPGPKKPHELYTRPSTNAGVFSYVIKQKPLHQTTVCHHHIFHFVKGEFIARATATTRGETPRVKNVVWGSVVHTQRSSQLKKFRTYKPASTHTRVSTSTQLLRRWLKSRVCTHAWRRLPTYLSPHRLNTLTNAHERSSTTARATAVVIQIYNLRCRFERKHHRVEPPLVWWAPPWKIRFSFEAKSSVASTGCLKEIFF